jgi:oligoribonuclease
MYLWLDLETTGLDPEVHYIIECAAIVTTPELKVLDHFEARISQPGATWSIEAAKMHLESGILDKTGHVLPNSPALDDTLENLIADHAAHRAVITLAGNSVHFDRGFLKRYCPRTDGILSHRHFDVSVVRDHVAPFIPLKFPKQEKPHRAMEDIEQALDLARFFRKALAR